MRVLVVGTTPPPGGRAARELAAIVAQRINAGDQVEVLSPDVRSAAHHTGNLSSVLLPIRLALLARRFDALVLRIEPGLPFDSETGRMVRSATLIGLGIVARIFSEVTIRLDSPIAIPGGVGGRATIDLWRRVKTVVVGNEHDRQQMLEVPGIHADKVVIDTPLVVQMSDYDHSWPSATEDDLREQILARVRQRSMAERQANSARVDLGDDQIGPLVSEAFSSDARVVPNISMLAWATLSRVARGAYARLVALR